MEREFLPYEIALELKELGFDEHCFGYFYTEDKFFETKIKNSELDEECSISAPTFSQALRWFREKYKVEGYINLNDSKENNFHYYFNYVNTNNIHNRREYCDFFIGNFKTYEEAELECLKKLIKTVKQK